jgi:Zn-dependent oligopeptidase
MTKSLRRYRRKTRKQRGGALLPFPDFSAMTPEIVQEKIDERIRDLTAQHATLSGLSNEALTFGNFIFPQYNIINNNPHYVYFNLYYYHPDEKVRKISEDADHSIDTLMNEHFAALFKKFDYYYRNQYPRELDSLSHERRRYIEFLKQKYEKLGNYQNDEVAAIIRNTRDQIGKQTIEIWRNIRAYNPSITFTRKELPGLPEDLTLNETNGVVTLQKKDFDKVLKSCTNDETCKTIYESSNTIPGNLELSNQIFTLRQQMATALGYPSYADFAHRYNMDNSAPTIIKYIDDLISKLEPLQEEYLQQLYGFAKVNPHEMKPWKLAYYEKNYQAQNGIDEEDILKYFPIFSTYNEVLKIYGEIMGWNFVEQTEFRGTLWNDNVIVHDVYDKSRLIGRIVGDLLENDIIKKQTFMDSWVGRTFKTVPLIVVKLGVDRTKKCANQFDLNATFHELGHAMHNLSLNTEISRATFFRWENDFTEIPSQLFEQLVFEPTILKRLLVVNNPSLEESEIDTILATLQKIQRSKYFERQWWWLHISKMDLMAHSALFNGTTEDMTRNAWISMETLGDVDDYKGIFIPNMFANGHFTHFLQEKYAACYNTYILTQGYAIDLYSKFNINNLPAAGDYAKSVLLAHGGSLPARRTMQLFLGRDPNPVEEFVRALYKFYQPTPSTATSSTRRSRKRRRYNRRMTLRNAYTN